MDNEIKSTTSSGNVFADIGLPDAEERLAKAKIAANIGMLIQERNLTQESAALLLGIDQPTVSKLLRGSLKGFSTDRLFRFLNLLDQDIQIVIRPRSACEFQENHSGIHVVMA